MKNVKEKIITFKADAALIEAMKGITNRSEFIRNAILASLDSACPLCSGTGILSPQQKKHFDRFMTNHSLEKCEECNELYFSCPIQKKTLSAASDHNPMKTP
ncbi:MAG: CopG family transcriptional regulator [Deltaproteobacteria bacterium]|nr:CopG family transcriptional regulator [Deltaproteobacteria bacterium]